MKVNHAVCIPFPAQGHIRPMLKLAQLLHFKFGFHITFINTHYNQQTLFQSQQYYYYDSQNNKNNNPTFRFETLPQEIGEPNPKDKRAVLNSILDGEFGPPIKEVLLKLGSKDYYLDLPRHDSRVPVSCVVSDNVMSPFTVDVAEEMGIPAVGLETCSGCGMMGYLQHRQLIDKGIIPLKDISYLTNGYLDMEIDWISSLKGLQLKDMPTSIRTTDPKDKMMNQVMSCEYRALSFQAIIINTFEALDQEILKELSSFSPNIYSIGPLHLLVNHIPITNTIKHIAPPQYSNEDSDYIQWLDLQEPNSILYVNFGTLAFLTQEQLVEFAWGLANSHKKFFWVVRHDLVIDGSNFLPLEFEEVIKERGKLASWCDQDRVLGHPCIGGFLTHCGWNSIIESVSHGVPMICWPIFAEQPTNSFYCCNYLNIGLKLSEVAKRNEIERVVRELMEGEKGKEMKKKAIEWKLLAMEATMSPVGSSFVNLKKIVNILASNTHES